MPPSSVRAIRDLFNLLSPVMPIGQPKHTEEMVRLSHRYFGIMALNFEERRQSMLTEKQQLAIKAIAEGADNETASKISGLGKDYIAKLKGEAEFSHALALCCVDRLKGLLPDSISKLGEIIRSNDPALYGTQVQAVKTVLEYSRIADLAQEVPSELTVTVRYE